MSVQEIARRLYKRGWADHSELLSALDALEHLSDADLAKVEELGKQYGGSN